MIMSSPKDKSEIYLELESIYAKDEGDEDDFRHYYSDIFAVLSQIDKDPSLGDMEILSQNMDLVRKGYQSQNSGTNGEIVNIGKQINKLYDHINLDIARMNYFKTTELRSQTELQRVSETLEKIEDNVKEMEGTVEKADEIQKQYITILGIFASIVLAFTGGIAFSTSVLENISNSSIYRTVLIAVGLAFVLLNIIYILTRFVMEISKKKEETIEYPTYMKILNGLCIVSVVLVILCWFFDVSKAATLFQNWLY